MLPRPLMVTTIKLITFKALPVALCIALVAGCKPPGPKALLDGKRLLEKGRVEIALERLQVATQLMPTNAHAWNFLGIACHQAGQSSNAVVAYQRALQLDADLSEVRMNLGTLWLESGHVAEAKTEFTAYNLRRPNDPEGFKQLALAELKGRELAAAESHVRKALQLDEGDAGAWNTLGLIQLQLGQPQAAARSFETALDRDSRLAAARFNLAVVLHQQLGNPGAALKQYRLYLDSKPRPTDADEIVRLVAKLTEESNPQAAPQPVWPAAPQTPSLPVPDKQQAVSPVPATRDKSTAEVLPDLKQNSGNPSPRPTIRTASVTGRQPAPNTTPEVPAPARSAASAPQITHISQGDEDEPQPVWRRDVTPLPGDRPRARYNAESIYTAQQASLADIRASTPGTAARRRAEEFAAKGQRAMQAHRYSEAADAFKAACAADTGWFQAQLNYSGAAIEAGRTSEAIIAARGALALQPESISAQFNLALAQRQAGQWGEAAACLERILSRNPSNEGALLTLANLCAEELAQPDKARGWYLKLLQVNPGHPQAGAIHLWLKQNPAN